MTKFVWLASYPRSGETWLRLLVAELLLKPAAGAAELDRMVPSLHRGVRAEQLVGSGSRFIATHWAWRPDLPLREDVIGAIYIMRDPLAIATELARLRAARADPEAAGRTLDSFIEHGGDPAWRRQGIGSWEENVRSWLAKSNPLPRLILRYEDMAADAGKAATDICRFLKVQKSAEEIASAAAAMSHERWLEWEARNAAAGDETAASGEVALDAARREAALTRFGPTMRLTGHLPPSGPPAA